MLIFQHLIDKVKTAHAKAKVIKTDYKSYKLTLEQAKDVFREHLHTACMVLQEANKRLACIGTSEEQKTCADISEALRRDIMRTYYSGVR